ncbi:thiamine biosynthesis protein ThiF [Cohnella sp. AR92]|nr:thiamine biosynthesis protein ThiF [Cohnella sp. AR92]
MRPYFSFTLIGTGATGSHFYRSLCQDLRSHMDKPGFDKKPSFKLEHVMLIDGDTVEKKNLGNQLFDAEDIGERKVISLAERYGEHYDLPVKYYPEYVKDLETLNGLVSIPEHSERHFFFMPVLIGMVDNNATRRLIDDFFYQEEVYNLIYIDTGVEGVASAENTRNVDGTGFGGQVVIGFKYAGQVILEPVGRVYTNILEDQDSPFPGCGVQLPSQPQRAATNKMAAQLANNIVNNLLHTFGIYQHVINFNCQYGGSSPVLISKETMKEFEMIRDGGTEEGGASV